MYFDNIYIINLYIYVYMVQSCLTIRDCWLDRDRIYFRPWISRHGLNVYHAGFTSFGCHCLIWKRCLQWWWNPSIHIYIIVTSTKIYAIFLTVHTHIWYIVSFRSVSFKPVMFLQLLEILVPMLHPTWLQSHRVCADPCGFVIQSLCSWFTHVLCAIH